MTAARKENAKRVLNCENKWNSRWTKNRVGKHTKGNKEIYDVYLAVETFCIATACPRVNEARVSVNGYCGSPK
jgi:hypothetical protein